MVYADWIEEEYRLHAEFANLPQLPDELFYEGWIVGGAESLVSTGELTFVEGVYVNDYTNAKNLTNGLRYVLTIEPRDNDPTAAEHVLEGEFEQL
jgi:hypothetical protein